MPNYKIKFTEKENNLFNTIERKNTRISIMSLYAYLIGKAEEEIKAGNSGILSFSFRPFLEKYNRSHKYISVGTLKNRIGTLISLGLLTVEKVKQNCAYKLNRFLNSSKVDKDTENTSLDYNCFKHKYINNNINIDIDLYSNPKKEFYSDGYEKCTSLVDVRKKVKELIKACRVKSNWIRDKVLIAITKNYRNITVKFLENYILKTIKSAREAYKNNWVKYNNVTIKQVREANFTQREYDWVDLEKKLLAHY